MLVAAARCLPAPALQTSQVRVPQGILEGVISADDKVRTFKGVPYAAPPVGPLRWKAPQAPLGWNGVRRASEYGARCMQGHIYQDMIFQDNGPSEDCLSLNLWMPAHPATGKLPVMVWIYGGGFNGGSSSEPRQDGGNLAKQGVLVVSMNYRLGIFGFFAHPALAEESGHDSAGNYGLLDQLAALKWVHQNIQLFGGDPDNVTIFGESAGASSVSMLIASPLAKGLFKRAIGESGSAMNALHPPASLLQAEQSGSHFAAEAFQTASIEQLRSKPAAEILDTALKTKDAHFSICVDGYFLPESPLAIYTAGKQSHVPLLAGWNADEGSAKAILGEKPATVTNLKAELATLYPQQAEQAMKLYSTASDSEVKKVAEELSRDRGVGSSMWRWLELQRRTGDVTTYRYQFDRPRPFPPGSSGPDLEPRAYHSAEIEYVFNVLPHRDKPWPSEDHRLAEMMSTYWANFAKTGDPNGAGLPSWPPYNGATDAQVMHFDLQSKTMSDRYQPRYRFIIEASPQSAGTTPRLNP